MQIRIKDTFIIIIIQRIIIIIKHDVLLFYCTTAIQSDPVSTHSYRHNTDKNHPKREVWVDRFVLRDRD